MPYLQRSGKPTLHYELDDYTDPWRNAPVMVLQHGFSRSSRFWYSWVPYLSRFYRVIRPDLRGLGQSARNLDLQHYFGLEHYLDDLAAIAYAVGADSIHYCGESFGGILGLALAAERPQLFRTLSVISAPTFISDHDKESTTYGHGSRVEALRKMGAREWAKASNSGRRFPADADPGLLEWYVDEMGKSDVEVLVAMFAWVSNFSTVPYLSRIEAPVLGLYPSQGPITEDTQIRVLEEAIKEIRIVRVPSRYHCIATLQPAACATSVLHFAAQYDGIPCRE
jgi:3-oxoadipate enol-lactonase